MNGDAINWPKGFERPHQCTGEDDWGGSKFQVPGKVQVGKQRFSLGQRKSACTSREIFGLEIWRV